MRPYHLDEYGHLVRRFPRNKSSTLNDPKPPREDKGKAKVSNGLADSEGFTQDKSHNRGKGKKRTWLDRQTNDTFNKFDVLGDMVQEEGIPVDISPEAKSQHEILVGDM